MPRYRLVTEATRIPVPGDKLIEESFGWANTATDELSLAHRVAPPEWSEPPQTPRFGELTLILPSTRRGGLFSYPQESFATGSAALACILVRTAPAECPKRIPGARPEMVEEARFMNRAGQEARR